MLGLGNTLSGGIVPAAAAFSNAKSIDFDGSNDYAVSGSNIAITRGTYQFWMKTTTAESGTPMKWSGTQNAYLVASGGELYFWVVWPMGNKLYIVELCLQMVNGIKYCGQQKVQVEQNLILKYILMVLIR